MEGKAGTGCVVVAAVSMVVMVVAMSLYMTTVRSSRKAALAEVQEAQSRQEEIRRRVVEQEAAKGPQEVPDEVLTAREQEPGKVLLERDKLPPYERHERGAPLKIEELVAARTDQGATNLVREVFRENAEGAPVRWSLKAQDVVRRNGSLEGEFSIDYLYWRRFESRVQSGSLTVRCTFVATSANELLAVRRGDVVFVEGRFSMKDGRPSIQEAILVREAAE